MRKVREILRLRLGVGLSADKVAKSCKVGKTTVLDYEKRFRQAGLSWPLPADVDDSFLERVVRTRLDEGKPRRDMSDTGYLISEMRKAHVTLHLLWLEYRESHPDGYGYTQFCHYYNSAKARVDLVLRQEHRAGEKLFTDYAGDTLKLTNPRTGELKDVYIFVAVLGASNCTFAEGVTSLDVASWIGSHIRAFEFFGGVPEIVVPDNTKCAVIRPDRYDLDLNPSFADDSRALRRRHNPGKGEKTKGQGQGRSGCPGSREMDSATTAKPRLLQPRGRQ
jgi:transposase